MSAQFELEKLVIAHVLSIQTYGSWEEVPRTDAGDPQGYPFCVVHEIAEEHSLFPSSTASVTPFRPATNMRDAWRVVEKMLSSDHAEDFTVHLAKGADMGDGGSYWPETVIQTLFKWLTPERICLAALAAVGQPQEGPTTANPE